jgi:hypothetical protein
VDIKVHDLRGIPHPAGQLAFDDARGGFHLAAAEEKAARMLILPDRKRFLKLDASQLQDRP